MKKTFKRIESGKALEKNNLLSMKGFVIGLFNKIFERSRMSDRRRNVLMLFLKRKGACGVLETPVE